MAFRTNAVVKLFLRLLLVRIAQVGMLLTIDKPILLFIILDIPGWKNAIKDLRSRCWAIIAGSSPHWPLIHWSIGYLAPQPLQPPYIYDTIWALVVSKRCTVHSISDCSHSLEV